MKPIYYDRSDHKSGEAVVVFITGRYRVIKFKYHNFHRGEAFACQRRKLFWGWRTLTHYFSGYVGDTAGIGARPGTLPSHYQTYDSALKRIETELTTC